GGVFTSMVVLLGNGDGTFRVSMSLPSSQGNVSAVVSGDFNHDGKLDLAVALPRENKVSIFLGNGDGSFQAPADVATDLSSYLTLVTGDFNGDGNLDLVADVGIVDPVGSGLRGLSSRIDVLLGNGDGTFNFSHSRQYLVDHTSMSELDADRDGK